MSNSARMLPIKVVADDAPVTSHAGLLPYLDLWRRFGMPEATDASVSLCGGQGWTDRQMVLSLVLLNLAGGESMTDIESLESDKGLCALIRSFERTSMNAYARRTSRSRFRSGRSRTFPAATQIATFLEACRDAEAESVRVSGKAYIPKPTAGLQSLRGLNATLISRLQACDPQTTATLDGDATLVETQTKTALFSYEGYRAYQPYNVYWSEQGVVLDSEFRDGNVPAGHEVTRVMKESLKLLPAGVTKVMTRQDTAAYQTEFLAWCERASEHAQYGRIEFTVSADISPELRAAIKKIPEGEWQAQTKSVKGERVSSGREYAEVTFVPLAQALLSDIQEPFRYIAIRQKLGPQLSLMDAPDASGQAKRGLPFACEVMNRIEYKISAIVTNRREEDMGTLIDWHYKRCGKSEEAHSVMKSDFAGGRLPSAKFGSNAAWWALMILSMNLQRIMSGLMGEGWTKRRMKAVRYRLINAPGRLVEHARSYFLRVPTAVARLLCDLRAAISMMRPAWT